MEREIAKPSESYKKLMRSNKDKLDTFTRDMVESHRKYYDKVFVILRYASTVTTLTKNLLLG